MVDTVVGYFLVRFFVALRGFFVDWYAGGGRWFIGRLISTLESMDQYFAVRVTARHFFEPLYKDYTIIGRILGIVFRSIRMIFGGAIYVVIAIVHLAFFLAWYALPIALIVSSVRGYLASH